MIDLTSDFEVLAATIDGEAERELTSGKEAVASTVLTRVKQSPGRKQFGDGTIRGACLAPEQFDCWMPGPDRDRIMALDVNNPTPAFEQCIAIAKKAMAGELTDITNGATFYYARNIPAPFWVAGAMYCGQFGSQLFWKGVK